jgi:hypothetical protein
LNIHVSLLCVVSIILQHEPSFLTEAFEAGLMGIGEIKTSDRMSKGEWKGIEKKASKNCMNEKSFRRTR